MRRSRLSAAALAAVTMLASAAPRAGARDGVDIRAGQLSYRREGSVVEASGGVRAAWDGNTLVTDQVVYERDADRLRASGDVLLETPTVLIGAASCDLEVEAETGVLHDVEVQVKESRSSFGGSTVKKLPGLRFSIEDAYFTTCEIPEDGEPDWSLTGRQADVEVEGYGRIRDAAFRIRGFPVLYVPVLVFPAITRRQSGLLLPRVGLSDQRGFIFEQPYFWAIDKHQDLTTTALVETSARVGLGLEYRYEPSRRTSGIATLSYFNEAIRQDEETDVQSPLFKPDPGDDIPEDRVVFRGTHRQRTESELTLYGDAFLVSDDLVLRETNAVAGALRTRRYTDSRAGVYKQRDGSAFGHATYGFNGAYYQDLVGPDRYTLQRPARLWTSTDGEAPFGFGWALDGELSEFYREDSVDGRRMDVAGMLERPLLAHTSPLRASTWARARLTGYDNDDREVVDLSPPNDDEDDVGEPLGSVDATSGRAVGEAGLDVRTAFVRRYAFGPEVVAPVREPPLTGVGTVVRRVSEPGIWGEGGFRRRFSTLAHTIEPFSALRYTSATSEADLPLYDTLDRIDDRTTFTYGTASRFLFTEASTGRSSELARLSLSQTYNVEERVIDDHFSDVDATLGIRPRRDVSFSGLASYNLGIGSLRGAAATLSLERFALPFVATRRSQLDAAYRYVRRGAVPTAEDGLQTLEARTILALTDRFAVGLNGRYDFVSDELVESGGGFRIQSSCQCWTVDLGVVNSVNPDETQFRVQVELGGLGSIGSSALRYRTIGLYGVDDPATRAKRFGW